MDLHELSRIIGNDGLRDWLMQNQLLANPLRCAGCNVDMAVVNRADNIDGVRWRCSGCDKRRSIRTNSFFAHFPKISLEKMILVIYLWSMDDVQKQISRHTGMTENSVSLLCGRLRDICSADLQQRPIMPFGGPAFPVKCDESKFNHKRKANRGRFPNRDNWIFGIVTPEFTPARGYFTVVQRRDRATLQPIINRCILPGTEVHSDDWGAYRGLENQPNVSQHRVVVHKRHFVNPITGVHTQEIESAWNRMKNKIKKKKGISRENLQSFLNEHMWRDWKGLDTPFDNFIGVLQLQYQNNPV